MIYKDPDDGGYRVSFTSGITYEMPELDLADIEKIMDYNVQNFVGGGTLV